jgi:Rha family phage regulatory protein
MKTDLVEMHNGVPMVSSLQVAEHFGKQHYNVLRDIKSLQADANFIALNFEGNGYVDARGRTMPMYWMTKDGFSLLVMGFTGNEAMRWKIAYINAFNALAAAAQEADRRVYMAPENKADMLKLMDAYLTAKDQEIASERKSKQLLLADHTGMVDRMRAAERLQSDMMAKVRSLAAHAYKVKADLEDMAKSSQGDLLSGIDASKVTRFPKHPEE